jgi:hypothetical protein
LRTPNNTSERKRPFFPKKVNFVSFTKPRISCRRFTMKVQDRARVVRRAPPFHMTKCLQRLTVVTKLSRLSCRFWLIHSLYGFARQWQPICLCGHRDAADSSVLSFRREARSGIPGLLKNTDDLFRSHPFSRFSTPHAATCELCSIFEGSDNQSLLIVLIVLVKVSYSHCLFESFFNC